PPGTARPAPARVRLRDVPRGRHRPGRDLLVQPRLAAPGPRPRHHRRGPLGGPRGHDRHDAGAPPARGRRRARPSGRAGDQRRGMTRTSARSARARLAAGLRELYVAPYRRTFARAQRDEDDLFMMVVLAEVLGVPNPVSYYTVELLPVMYDRFHDWHRRMGMERSPLDHLSCC